MEKKSTKYLFIIQGEGRGHFTQALSLSHTLTKYGHEICAVLVGKSLRRETPKFFENSFQNKIHKFDSPNFVFDKQNKRVRLLPTIVNNICSARKYYKNLKKIDRIVKHYDPDVIVNFYDLLGGLYNALFMPKAEFICIGHQYLLLHPDFEFPKKRYIERYLVRLNTCITSLGASKRLALSFKNMQDQEKYRIKVLPPLLRKEVLNLQSENQAYFLIYLVNEGYAEEIIAWHEKHPDIRLHCFWDKSNIPEEYNYSSTLTFHQINDQKFLHLMKNCTAFISTAGFESICEAMYLGKPVMMVPTEGHFEQACNALDACKAKAGISNARFDLSILMDYLPKHIIDDIIYKEWVTKAEALFMKELELPLAQ